MAHKMGLKLSTLTTIERMSKQCFLFGQPELVAKSVQLLDRASVQLVTFKGLAE
jgi:hypothetical protein